MNTFFLIKQGVALSPSSDKATLAKAIKANKYIVLVQTQGFEYIDNLLEQIDLIEDIVEERQRGIFIFGDISEEHKILMTKIYPQFTFSFIKGE